MSSDSAVADTISTPAPKRWHWPPYPFTFAVAGCVLAVAFVANFPAWEVPRAGLNDGKYGPHFETIVELEHGWPIAYARRDIGRERPSATSPRGWTWEDASAWRPWEDVRDFSAPRIVAGTVIWLLAMMAAAGGAQYWRSRRRSVWQFGIRDLLGLLAVAALLCGWVSWKKLEYEREQSVIARYRARTGNPGSFEKDAPVPAFFSSQTKQRYRNIFGRFIEMDSGGDSDLACQFRHLLALREHAPSPWFRKHLAQMPQLEGLDLCFTGFPYRDATEQATLLRNLPPMTSLRGVNLYDTNVTDADLEWLAKCPRLELIDLSSMDVGDHGLLHLVHLSKLRILTISSPRITDEGCRTIAQIETLEELWLASQNIQDDGVRELGKLSKLRSLGISASASDAAFAELRKQLPHCDIHATGY
jgi:hypothetical protein